jgi:hypothetical protein
MFIDNCEHIVKIVPCPDAPEDAPLAKGMSVVATALPKTTVVDSEKQPIVAG